MGCRVLHGFGSGVCEALPVQLVNDIFFLHERGSRLGYYTGTHIHACNTDPYHLTDFLIVCLCLGSTGPLYAGYMLAGGYSWSLFFYVEFAFAMVLLIAAFFIVEETSYDRPTPNLAPTNIAPIDPGPEKALAAEHHEMDSGNGSGFVDMPARKTLAQQLKPWSHVKKNTGFFQTIWRSFTYFLVPSVFWVVCTYGIYIGLGALAFNYTFPIKIVAPPYNWSQTNSGLIAVASAVGYFLAIPFTFTSDRLAAHYTKKNDGIREAEMRLGVLLIPMLVPPAGLILYGLTAERNLHWFGYFAGVAMTNWGGYFFFTFTLAYAVDSYNANTSEMLIAMNLGKQAISFGMGSYLLDWILSDGYATVISGIFCAVLLLNNLALIIFMVWGKKIRVATSQSWLGKLHKRTMIVGETH